MALLVAWRCRDRIAGVCDIHHSREGVNPENKTPDDESLSYFRHLTTPLGPRQPPWGRFFT